MSSAARVRRLASGINSPEELAAIVVLLEALAQAGRPDLVGKVAKGEIRAIALLRLSQAGQPLPAAIPFGVLTLAEHTKAERRAMGLAEAVELMINEKGGRPRRTLKKCAANSWRSL